MVQDHFKLTVKPLYEYLGILIIIYKSYITNMVEW